jgi:hypothetical protein
MVALTPHARVYAVLSLYLIVCSFWLTGKSFAVRIEKYFQRRMVIYQLINHRIYRGS